MEPKMSLLSDKAILGLLDKQIVIHPFKKENLGTNSYDVTLGSFYCREQKLPATHNVLDRVYNPYSREDVARVWGSPQEASEPSPHRYELLGKFPGISDKERVIFIGPGETILCHTNEFIGGREFVTTMLKARSSIGRNFLTICSCAGMGDVGYVNRWTLEVTNRSRQFTIPLVVGRRIGQIVFFQTDGIAAWDYPVKGKYQQNNSIDALIEGWSPEDMLPKMYLDREVLALKNDGDERKQTIENGAEFQDRCALTKSNLSKIPDWYKNSSEQTAVDLYPTKKAPVSDARVVNSLPVSKPDDTL